MGAAPYNPEERRFLEELRLHFEPVVYLFGIGIRGFRVDQLWELPRKIGRFRQASSAQHLPTVPALKIAPARSALGRVNVWWLRHQLQAVMAGPVNKWTFWTRCPSPELVEAVEGMPFSRIVYEPIDRYAAHPLYTAAERSRIVAAERRLSQHALVIANSHAVARDFGGYWVPCGIDVAAGLRHEDGPSLPAAVPIPAPRILVMGALDWRIDQTLLAQVAIARPDWHLILAGPVSAAVIEPLKTLANVHWLGGIPPARARAVIANCQVTLIPYRLTDWTRACLPLKVFDYLAEGKPVVSTPLPELTPFADVISLAETTRFEAAIEEALHDSAAAAHRRRSVAAEHTVQKRTARIMTLLN
jgi:glycosyltransferase involved in cell wall biosynthesis